MICPDCGQEIQPGAKFCGLCGRRLNSLMPSDSSGDPTNGVSNTTEEWVSTREEAATIVATSPGEKEAVRSGYASGSADAAISSEPVARKRWPVWLWVALAVVSVLGLFTTTGVLRDLFSSSVTQDVVSGQYDLDLMPLGEVPRLEYGRPVTLNAGWITEEEVQAEDFLDSLGEMVITVNGVELQNVMSGWQGIEWVYYSVEQDEYPAVLFKYNLGTLDPGAYIVDTTLVLSREHDDGFEVYPAGLLWDWEMEFVILEK